MVLFHYQKAKVAGYAGNFAGTSQSFHCTQKGDIQIPPLFLPKHVSGL